MAFRFVFNIGIEMGVESLKDLDWNEILERLILFATSLRARESLRATAPLGSQLEAEKQIGEIIAAQIVLARGERPFMESLDLFSAWFDRLKKNAVLKPLELKDVRRFCYEVIALYELLKDEIQPWCKEMSAGLMDAHPPLSAIDQLLTSSGDIRTDASETLHKLYMEKTQLARTIQTALDKLVKKNQLEPILQDKYVTNREGRWVLPIKSGMQHAFNGIIHAASQSKQTVFMEPEDVIPVNNRLAQIEIEIEQEIDRLLMELSNYLSTQVPEFQSSAQILERADVRFAQAQLTQQLQASPCHFADNTIKLARVRHPLLALQNEKVVANDVEMHSDRRILLLSGPNAGGKTVLLKSIGIAAHMARCGLPICADEGSSIPFFGHLHVAVGDSQSVDAHLSTFAAHLKILNAATEAKGGQHLLLVDEIAGSTDPQEGAALARSFIEHYAKNQVFGVITSHLGPLKMGWDRSTGVVNGSLEYDAESGRPTYQFLMGIPGQSMALQTAKRVGVNESVLIRAFNLLSPEAKAHQRNLQEIEQMKEDLQKLRDDLAAEVKRTKEQKNKYLQLIDQFRRERDQWLEKLVQKAENKIAEVIDSARVKQIFRKHEVMEQVKNQFPELVKASKETVKQFKPETSEDFVRAYPPGSNVFIPSIGQDGVIQGTPNAKGEVPILSHSMRLFLPWQELRPPRQSHNPTAQILRRSSISVALTDQERVIDLRGRRVEEAIESLEMELDSASLQHEDRVKIIHGHGTEALKRAVRTYLSRSVYVKKWKAGSHESGEGDGVTWVEIRDHEDG